MAYNFMGYTFVSLSPSPSSSTHVNNINIHNNVNEGKTLVEKDLLCSLEEMKYYDASEVDVSLSLGPPSNVKKCFTCGQTDTPLWRSGPNGPKSLCNACGIRYRKQMKKLNTGLSLAPPNAYLAKNATRHSQA